MTSDAYYLDDLPRETLLALARMYARNWQTLDGLWFGNVEAEYGLDAAVKIDLMNWSKQTVVEGRRIKDAMKLEGGLASVLKALSLMSWQIASPLFKIEEKSLNRIVFYYDRCPVQESRRRNGKPVFPCKVMKTTLLTGLAGVIEPRASLTCLTCPPDEHPEEYWCRWMLTLP